jgi:hypothetical protein
MEQRRDNPKKKQGYIEVFETEKVSFILLIDLTLNQSWISAKARGIFYLNSFLFKSIVC